MNRRAVARLVALPFVRMPFGMVLTSLAWLACLATVPALGLRGSLLPAGVGWLMAVLLGLSLRTLMRSETLLLPGFTRCLGWSGAWYGAILVGLPVAILLATGGGLDDLLLAAPIQALAFALGLATGAGRRIALLAWVLFMIVTLALPASLQATLAHTLADSPWVPLLIALLTALVLRLTLRPLLTVRDGGDEDSPMQAIADGRQPARHAGGATPYRGRIGRTFMAALDGTATRNFAHALARFRRRPSQASRMALIRAVLLPHDNWRAVGINIVLIGAMAALYFALLHRQSQHWNAGLVASYAVILAMSRFTAAGKGLVKMRPNLADLYLALGPATQREFQDTIAQALLKLVAVTTFNCIIYTVLIAMLLHASALGELALTALIVGSATAFAALAAHLIGPTSQGGRLFVQMVLMMGALIVFNLVAYLMRHFGVLVGGLSGIIICMPFGLGAWHYARREYRARRPCFDVPLE